MPDVATMTRPRSGTTQAAGHATLFEGQQVSANVRVEITGPYQLKLSYQPLGSGAWQDVELDPIIQFAWFSYALSCGGVPQNIMDRLGSTPGVLPTRANGAAASGSTSSAQARRQTGKVTTSRSK